MTAADPETFNIPIFAMQIVTNGEGDFWPTIAFDHSMPEPALQTLSAMVKRVSDEFAAQHPPTDRATAAIAKAAANGAAIAKAEQIVREAAQ